jgi:hypothetical protein
MVTIRQCALRISSGKVVGHEDALVLGAQEPRVHRGGHPLVTIDPPRSKLDLQRARISVVTYRCERPRRYRLPLHLRIIADVGSPHKRAPIRRQQPALPRGPTSRRYLATSMVNSGTADASEGQARGTGAVPTPASYQRARRRCVHPHVPRSWCCRPRPARCPPARYRLARLMTSCSSVYYASPLSEFSVEPSNPLALGVRTPAKRPSEPRGGVVRIRASIVRIRASIVRIRASIVRIRASIVRIRASIVRIRASHSG